MPVNIATYRREFKPEYLSSASKWALYTIGSGFLPYIIALLIVWGSTQTVVLQDFVGHGELAIYSATLIAASIRLVGRDKEEVPPFLYREVFLFLCITILGVAIAIYTVIKAATVLVAQKPLNPNFMMYLSIGLVLFAIVIAFLVQVINEERFGGFSYRASVERTEHEVEAQFEHEPNRLEEQVEKGVDNAG